MTTMGLVPADMTAAAAVADTAADAAARRGSADHLATAVGGMPGSGSERYLPELGSSWDDAVRSWAEDARAFGAELQAASGDVETTDGSVGSLFGGLGGLLGGPR